MITADKRKLFIFRDHFLLDMETLDQIRLSQIQSDDFFLDYYILAKRIKKSEGIQCVYTIFLGISTYVGSFLQNF